LVDFEDNKMIKIVKDITGIKKLHYFEQTKIDRYNGRGDGKSRQYWETNEENKTEMS